MSDQQYSYDLAFVRGQQREVNETKAVAGEVVKPPSALLYAFLYFLSIVGDIVDIAEITVVGEVVTFILDLFIGAILFFSGRAAKKRIDGMNQFQDLLHNRIQNIEKKILAYRNAYARVLRMSRKVKLLRKPVRKLALRFAKLRKSVARNPTTRTVLAIIADFIPIIQWIPWRTVNIYMMKKDEMRAFHEAQNMIPEYMGAKADEIQAANDLADAEAVEAGAEQTA